jgi:magnesium-transporting ATPase (P-type)
VQYKDLPVNDAPKWHSLSKSQALESVQSTPEGLSDEQVAQRRALHGPNQLPAPSKRPAWVRFVQQFHNVLIYVLLGAALITALLGHLLDTFVILAVVLINAVIGFLQEGKAEKALEAIRHMLAPQAAVLRTGTRHRLAAEELVPGETVLLEAGDKVPADLRLLKAHDLQTQEAILTGESAPVEKHTVSVDASAVIGDRFNIAYSGTHVTRGQGRGVVVATGSQTEIGRISGLLLNVETLTTPLVEQMAVFAKWLTVVILGVALLILGYGYWGLQHNFDALFIAMVALIVSAIPEGLPAVLSITLAVGVQAMARRNAIVRRLPIIETLGSVSVICTDKTGTLTHNEMSVVCAVTAQHTFTLDGEGYAPEGQLYLDGAPVTHPIPPVLKWLGLGAALCNDAELKHHEGLWQVHGDPMEGALLSFAHKTGVDGEPRHQWARTDLIPFDAKHKYMATLNHDHQGQAFVFVKGAPEVLLSMCTLQHRDHEEAPLDSDYWHQQAETIANQGQRVLALACKPVEVEHTVLEQHDLNEGLILLGLVGLIDPPRPEAVQAIAECHAAGIEVKMITGDHAATAKAIGKAIGLNNSDRVLTGSDLDKLDEAQLKTAVADTDIFARTTPEHKLRLVKALQAQDRVVAMTGDGVNDAPALKRADAGIAMGKKGSEAAKEASDLVLADDNFASIVAAVREGRTVYTNIKKVISWTLPTSAGESSTLILALMLGMTLPITPVQILWVNMITAVTLGIALAFEPIGKHTMQRPPRPRNQALLDRALVWHIVLVSGLILAGVFGVFSYAVQQGYSTAWANTMAMNTLVAMKIFHLFFIRNVSETRLTWKALLGTRAVWIAVLLASLGQLALTYVPWLQTVFATEAISASDHLLILGVGLSLFVIIELEKQLRLRLLGAKASP